MESFVNPKQESTKPFSISAVKIAQPQRGYRFTVDAVTLAEYVQIAPTETLLDLGTGVGVIPLLIWQRSSFRYAVGVELQPELAQLASKNVLANALPTQMSMMQADVRVLRLQDFGHLLNGELVQGFNVITANPPYRPIRQGRTNLNPQKAIARHELQLTLAELAAGAARCIKPGGRFYLVHLAEREEEILRTLEKAGFVLVRREYASISRQKPLILIEARFPLLS
jgi:tRNA1Val (adenine37-N6)-methyltransferase